MKSEHEPKESRDDFVRKIYAAYFALTEVRCHHLGPPGIKGLQEEFLDLVEVTEDEMIRIVFPATSLPTR